jgi:hypothetical protein
MVKFTGVQSSYHLVQEEIRDLFNPDATALRIVDDPVVGPYVKGVTEEVVLSPERVLELMAIGEANRHVASTNMNLRSSRSHTLFKMVIESRQVGVGGDGSPGLADPVAVLEQARAAAAVAALHPPPLPLSARPTSRGGFRDRDRDRDRDDASVGGAVAVNGNYNGTGGGLSRTMSNASISFGGAPATPVVVGVPTGTPSLVAAGGAVVRVSSLHLIDLAGSERVSKTGSSGTQVGAFHYFIKNYSVYIC